MNPIFYLVTFTNLPASFETDRLCFSIVSLIGEQSVDQLLNAITEEIRSAVTEGWATANGLVKLMPASALRRLDRKVERTETFRRAHYTLVLE